MNTKMLDIAALAREQAARNVKTGRVDTGVAAGAASLNGFDKVYSITQDTVNSQFEWLQVSGIIPSDVHIGVLETDGITIGGTGADAATIDPPTVDFDTGSSRAVRMLLSFTGGALRYYKGFGANQTIVRAPLKGWKLALNVSLNLGPDRLCGHRRRPAGSGRDSEDPERVRSGNDAGQQHLHGFREL